MQPRERFRPEQSRERDAQRLAVRAVRCARDGRGRTQFQKAPRVAQRGRIAQGLPAHQRAQHAAHVLAGVRLRELTQHDEVPGHGSPAQAIAHQRAKVRLLRPVHRRARFRDDKRARCCAQHRIWHSDDYGVAERRAVAAAAISEERVLNLLCPYTHTAHVDHLVGTAVERVSTILMAHGNIALDECPPALEGHEVAAPTRQVAAPVRGHARGISAARCIRLRAVWGAPDRHSHVRQRAEDDHIALLAGLGSTPPRRVPLRGRLRGVGLHRTDARLVSHEDGGLNPRQRRRLRVRVHTAAFLVPRSPNHATMLPRPEARLAWAQTGGEVSLGTGRAGRLGTQGAEAAAARGAPPLPSTR